MRFTRTNRPVRIPRIKTCCNCAHFHIVEEGFEIGRIEDTRYMTSECSAIGWRVKEHYLFPVQRDPYVVKEIKECPLWRPCGSSGETARGEEIDS